MKLDRRISVGCDEVDGGLRLKDKIPVGSRIIGKCF